MTKATLAMIVGGAIPAFLIGWFSDFAWWSILPAVAIFWPGAFAAAVLVTRGKH